MTDQAKERGSLFAPRCRNCGIQPGEFRVTYSGPCSSGDGPDRNRHSWERVGVVPASLLEERDRVLGELRETLRVAGISAECIIGLLGRFPAKRLRVEERPDLQMAIHTAGSIRDSASLALSNQGGEADEDGQESVQPTVETRPTLSPSEPWGHKLHVSIYIEGEPDQDQIDFITNALNKAAPEAEFVGMAIREVEEEPIDHGTGKSEEGGRDASD